MEGKGKLEKIMEVLGLSKEADEVKLETVEVKAEAQKLDNGTMIEADSFEAEQEVFIVSDEDRVAMPVGEYKFEDGRVMVVEVEGVIASIGEASEEAPAEEEVEQSSEFVTVEDFNNAIKDIKAMLTSHDEEVLKKHETEKAELSSQVDELKVELSEVPAAKKINSSPEAKQTEVKFNKISPNRRQTTQDRVMDMLFKIK